MERPIVRPAPLGDIGTTYEDITSFLNNLEQRLHDAQSDLARVNNAVQGAAAGAQAGWNAPTDMKPFLIGGAVVLGVLLLSRR